MMPQAAIVCAGRDCIVGCRTRRCFGCERRKSWQRIAGALGCDEVVQRSKPLGTASTAAVRFLRRAP
jgi:hypothetical protein